MRAEPLRADPAYYAIGLRGEPIRHTVPTNAPVSTLDGVPVTQVACRLLGQLLVGDPDPAMAWCIECHDVLRLGA
ncbi:hypothetical protein FHX42_004421 [Saccharopolyspora lacisalsi]|uniref:Uncharacterized protein n=1 Tax=Halosaccharopolyspora lacisalsi TaxID=1000566 RepID=A0A839E5N4_9PSEU|nr:hypothetical protein [Halosaccharopolyspora lacisalsi]MBA8827037.1 hypothetical protein [Halosaccharopolyspora lacisalsi]